MNLKSMWAKKKFIHHAIVTNPSLCEAVSYVNDRGDDQCKARLECVNFRGRIGGIDSWYYPWNGNSATFIRWI